MRPVLLGVLLAAGAVVTGAIGCSSSNSNIGSSGDDGGSVQDSTAGSQDSASGHEGGGEASTGNDGGTGSDTATAGDSGTDGAGLDSATSDTGSSADGGDGAVVDASCGSTPSLHVDTPGSIFCGYDFEAGADLTCATGQECCLGGSIGGGLYAQQACSTWTANGTGCTNPADGGAIGIACSQISDCTANGVTGATVACCLQGGTVPVMAPGCTYPKSTLGSAIVCEAAGSGGAASAGTCAAGEIQICSADSDCPTGKTCTPGKWKIFQVGFCL
jgi:hypothetical protein